MSVSLGELMALLIICVPIVMLVIWGNRVGKKKDEDKSQTQAS